MTKSSFDKYVHAMTTCGGRAMLAVLLLLCVAPLACGPRGIDTRMRGGPELVEGGVIFRYFDRDARRVYVVGDFNNWSLRADPMVDKNGDGEWTLFYPLSPGRYEYKFVVNGTTWIADPRNPSTVPDGFDGRNSVIVIPPAGS